MIKEYLSTIVLGATGSVGEQALEVAAAKRIRICGLSANKNYKRLEAQARRFHPYAVAMSDEEAAAALKICLSDTDVKVYSGSDGICHMIEETDADAAVNAILGKAGLMPTLSVISSGKRLALANKESLVVAGEIVMAEVAKNNTELLPVDSEHCAIHQCLRSGNGNEVSRLILTASGGPFFGYRAEQLKDITPEQALAHPTWTMGAKITIDSATLMNKGFEIIEAAHLFSVDAGRIDVVVHRESIIHSMVEYIDNSVIAQLSVPDMRHCVQYALTYPERDSDAEGELKKLDFTRLGGLTFAEADGDTFVLLNKAKQALHDGGAMPAVLNAANEVAVEAFLQRKIGFYDIMETVCDVYDSMTYATASDSLEDILECDKAARALAHSKIGE